MFRRLPDRCRSLPQSRLQPACLFLLLSHFPLDSVPYYLPALHFTLPMPAKFSSQGFFRPLQLLSPRCLLFTGLFSSFYASFAPLFFLRGAFFVFLCFFRPAVFSSRGFFRPFPFSSPHYIVFRSEKMRSDGIRFTSSRITQPSICVSSSGGY